MKKLNIALLAIVMFALMLTSVTAADKVIGKAHIKKGTNVNVFIPVPNSGSHMPFHGVLFKDQTFYILKKVKDNDTFIYKVDATGLSHDCPAHGEEVFNEQIFIVFTDEAVDGDKIKIELFEEKGK